MKTKFNPKDVPDWCKWITVDEDGTCCAFREAPHADGFIWDSKPTAPLDGFKELYKGKPPKNWKDELYTWGY